MTGPDYEAQFTRGYTGPPIVPPVAPAQRDEVAPADADAASLVEPRSPLKLGTPIEPDTLDALEQPSPQNVAESAPARPAPNPWSIALLIASLAMVTAGFSLLRLYATTTANGYALNDQTAVLLIQSNIGAALITAGIVGVIAWLVLLALRGRDRRGSA